MNEDGLYCLVYLSGGAYFESGRIRKRAPLPNFGAGQKDPRRFTWGDAMYSWTSMSRAESSSHEG